MMTSIQSYIPLDNLFVSALVASLPLAVLLGLLVFFRARTFFTMHAGLVTSLGIAMFISIALAALVGLLTFLQALAFSGMGSL